MQGKEPKRFEVIYSQGAIEKFTVIRDNDTGVNYLYFKEGGYPGGLTVLLDREGKPKIDR